MMELSNKRVILLQRVVSTLAVAFSGVCIAMMLFGFVPFMQRSANVLVVFENAFEVLKIFNKNFWQCIACGVFALFYAFQVFNSLKMFLSIVRERKQWFMLKHDTAHAREQVNVVVLRFNRIMIRLTVLMIVSYIIDAYRLDGGRLLLLAIVVLANFVANALKLFYFKRNVEASTFAPISVTLIMCALFIYLFKVLNVQVLSLLKQLYNVLFILGMDDMSVQYVLATVIMQILMPILHLYIIYCLLDILDDAMCYAETNRESFAESIKTLNKKLFIILGVIAAVQCYAYDSLNFEGIFNVVLYYVDIVLVLLGVYFLSRNAQAEYPNAPTEEELAEAAAAAEYEAAVEEGEVVEEATN